MNPTAAIVYWLKKLYHENTKQSEAIKVWLKDDVRQHDVRLDEYKKQTVILNEILETLKAGGCK